MFGYPVGNDREDLARDDRNDARVIPKCTVIDQSFDWGQDKSPRRPLAELTIYEIHVAGFT